MSISDLNQFISNFFTAHQCKTLYNQDGVLTFQLTEAMDRALMNRPFYWHYIKKIGQTGEPQALTLITNPEKKKEIKGELIHFGSPRLQQIMNHLKSNERFTKAFENIINNTSNTALHPWLVTNIKITYTGKMQKDEMFSIGLNLVTGAMKSQMMEYLYTIDLQNTISDYCYTISPMIKLKSGFKRIESVIEDYLQNQSHTWADRSIQTMKEDIQLVEHFYTDTSEEDKEQLKQELTEIKKRYEPKITMSVVNGGVFYLSQKS